MGKCLTRNSFAELFPQRWDANHFRTALSAGIIVAAVNGIQ